MGSSRGESREVVAGALHYHGATVPAGTVHEMPAARVGGAGNAGRGALPTAGKREEISF